MLNHSLVVLITARTLDDGNRPTPVKLRVEREQILSEWYRGDSIVFPGLLSEDIEFTVVSRLRNVDSSYLFVTIMPDNPDDLRDEDAVLLMCMLRLQGFTEVGGGPVTKAVTDIFNVMQFHHVLTTTESDQQRAVIRDFFRQRELDTPYPSFKEGGLRSEFEEWYDDLCSEAPG